MEDDYQQQFSSHGPSGSAASDAPFSSEGNDAESSGGAPSSAPVPQPHAAAAPPLAAHYAEPDQAARLNELEATLRQPDAVLEPTILTSLRDYVVAQGHPQQAVDMLTEHYVGYAQMASLACDWLKFVDAQTARDAAAQPAQLRAAAPAGSKAGPESRQFSSSGGAAARAAGGSDAHAAPALSDMDEAYFLSELVREQFDPQRFAGIFSAGGSGAPQWLNALIQNREGRQLIYDLSARHQSSLLLNFAMQKILMQPGRDAEAASMGPALVGTFGVYHRLLGARLRQAAAAQDEATLQRLCKELCDGAVGSQHAYAHAQQMLQELAADDGPWAPRFRRMAQELEASVPGPVVCKMHRWFVRGVSKNVEEEREVSAAAWLVSDVLANAAVAGGTSATSDVMKLYRMYCNDVIESGGGTPPAEDSEERPSVELLRHPRLIKSLLHALFSPGRQLQPEAQAAFTGLAALAVAAVDPINSPSTALKNGSILLEQPAVVAARSALQEAVDLAHKALRDEVLTDADRVRAEQALREPCCALGLLGMLRSRLTSSEYWSTAYHIHKEPPFLSMLLAAVQQQPSLHADILTLVSDSLAAMGHAPSGPDVARGLLQVAVAIASAGRAEEVLTWADVWARNADSGLVRHLLFSLLEIAAPPYSPRFAASMLRLASACGARRQRMGGREWAARAPLLAEFAAACAEVAFDPSLGRDEASFLRELNISLKR